MARHFVVVALVFFAIVGMASAEANSPTASKDDAPALNLAPKSDIDVIGTTDGSNSGAAPVGGPVPEGTFSNVSPAESPKSASSTIEASTFAGIIVSALVGSFVF